MDPELQYHYKVVEGNETRTEVSPFLFRTTRVGEDLGLVKYLFSDKTGIACLIYKVRSTH